MAANQTSMDDIRRAARRHPAATFAKYRGRWLGLVDRVIAPQPRAR